MSSRSQPAIPSRFASPWSLAALAVSALLWVGCAAAPSAPAAAAEPQAVAGEAAQAPAAASGTSSAPGRAAAGEASTSSGRLPPPSDASAAPEALRMWVVDVGQGDGTIIISPEGRVIVFDAGTRGGGANVVSLLRQLGVRTVDLAVMSHAHNDHMGGFRDIIDNFTVRRFLDPGFAHTSQVYLNLLDQLAANEIPIFTVETGARIRVDSFVEFEVLAPSQPFFRGTRSDVNANGIVVLMHFGAHRILMMGDAEAETERRLLAEGNLTPVDVLRVAHHGSRHSSLSEFLAVVQPRIAIISCGANNSYGHPAPETLERLERAGVAEIYRTDLHGTILIESNGEVMVVTPARLP